MKNRSLKKVSTKQIKVFKIKNRRGYAAICFDNLTEGSTPKQAVARLAHPLRRMGWSLVVLLGLLIVVSPAQADTTSLSKLIGAGQSVQCTYSKSDSTGTQSGTIYVADQKMRGDMQVASPDGTYPMHMIHESGWQYLWGGPFGESQGMKMQFDPSGAPPSPHGKQGPDLNENMDYQCQPWAADASKFVPPTEVQFTDMASMMAGAGIPSATAGIPTRGNGGGMDIQAMKCGACEQAAEEDRAACKQAMGC